MKIKVISKRPDQRKGLEQCSITNIIGNVYDVVHTKEYIQDFFEFGEVSIVSAEFGGLIVLNKGEYEIVG